MGALIGLVFGLGCVAIWRACWAEDPDPTTGRAPLHRLAQRTRDDLALAGVVGVGPAGLAVAALTAGLIGAATTLTLVRVTAIAAVVGVVAAWGPVALVRGRASRERARRRDGWPDVVDHLASAIRAGMSLPEAVIALAQRGPEHLRPAFDAFGRDYRTTGQFGASLDALKVRLADPVADRLVEALRITRDVGGSDLGRLLRTLSAFLREDARTRSELEARQSWTVYGARLAVAAPWLVLALLGTRPEALVAYARPEGAAVLAVGAAISLLAYRLMTRIGRLPSDPRVLR
jgi:tight adherence protein B